MAATQRICTCLAGIALLLALAESLSAAPIEGWVSEPPVTYVLDYGPRHLGHPEWLEATASAPPMFLHLGKDVPMTHNWGPIEALGGENQAYGKGDYIRRLSPGEVAERIAGLKQMVAQLHDAGVTMVMPYICAMTAAGHHEKRTGLWEFYDNWADYASFGLGPRPELDVTGWLQRDPNGEMVRFYSYQGDFYPPYEPNHRYAACMNNPGWQQWLYAVTRLVAECGYDGAFVDNSGSQRCYCDLCQEKFRQFLAQRYDSADLDRLLGFKSEADIRLGTRNDGKLLWAETQRFWIETVHQHQMAIGAAARKVNPDFRVFPNGGHQRPEFVKLAYCDSDYIMFEKSVGDYGTNPGKARFKVVGNIAVNKYNDNIYEYKLTAATRSHVKPIILTRAGYPRRDPALDLNHWTTCLGMAEAAAFGSGGGFLVRPKYDEVADALNLYREFFEKHADLYAGYLPHATVGVALLPEQKLMGNTGHLQLVERLTRALADSHVLFDYLMEEDLTLDRLKPFQAVIVAGVSDLTQSQHDALADYAGQGGRVLTYPERIPMRDIGEKLTEACGNDLDMLRQGDKPAPRSVRLNAWQKSSGGEHRFVYHVLNYGAPLGEGAAAPEPVEGLQLALPAGEVRDAMIQVWEPGSAAGRAGAVSLEGDTALVELPPLTVYQVIAID